jgi:hypothetical protein
MAAVAAVALVAVQAPELVVLVKMVGGMALTPVVGAVVQEPLILAAAVVALISTLGAATAAPES